MQHPLSSIAERRSGSGEDSDEEEEEEGGWKSADIRGKPRDSVDESVIKSGYLWKKGERRKVLKPPDFDHCMLTLPFADLEEALVCAATSSLGIL